MARYKKLVSDSHRTPASRSRHSNSLDHADYSISDTSIDELDPLQAVTKDESTAAYESDDGKTSSTDGDGIVNGYREKSRKYTKRDKALRSKRLRRRLSGLFAFPFGGGSVPGKWFWPLYITRKTCLIGLLCLACVAAAFLYRKEMDEHPSYTRANFNGLSPPWYPSPKGGEYTRWEESYRKAAEMVNDMSLLEKVNITTGIGWSMGMCVGNTGPAVNVGFPSLCLQDGPLGLRFADNVTSGPAGITVGATWNKELMYKRGRMLGLEAHAKGVNVLLGPGVGPLGRIPAGGRNWEGFGTDPVLQGIAAAETIRGIQDEGVMATIKHFVGNEQEHFRQAGEWENQEAISSNIDDRTLHEVYAWPFADSIRAGVASVMCSYNQVNNSYACQNSKLLNGIIKDEMGFQGFIQSDWLAQRSGVASALSGLDMSMPGDGHDWADGKSYWGPQLTEAALNGSLPLERLDDMALRIIAAWYQFGQDDKERWPPLPPEGDGGPNFSSWTTNETGLLHHGSDDQSRDIVNRFVDATQNGGFSHEQLARRVAAEGIILLKNDDALLPLTVNGSSRSSGPVKKGKLDKRKIAIIGEDAIVPEGGPNTCADHGCNKGTLASGWGSGTAEFPYLISPLEALQTSFDKDNVELFVIPNNDQLSADDKRKLRQQDYCMVFVNSDGGEGFIASDGIHGDRNDLEIQKGGGRLIKEVSEICGASKGSAVGKTIVIIHTVGPVLIESFIERPQVGAVLFANLPGQESGNALADILFGRLNPSGHLPYTIARRQEDYGPAGEIIKHSDNNAAVQQNFTEGLMIDYRWFDENRLIPRYEFGYGLSYTTFELSDLVIESFYDRPASLPRWRPSPECQPPKVDSEIPSPEDAVFPSGWRKLNKYIYPYIDSVADIAPNNTYHPPYDETEQPSQAGGGEGGHPDLWEIMAHVEVDVFNEGQLPGQAVVQLYVAFPNATYEEDLGDQTLAEYAGIERHVPLNHDKTRLSPSSKAKRDSNFINFPVRVLRSFEKVHLRGSVSQMGDGARYANGEKKRIGFDLTRRDLSYWSVRKQNWVLPLGTFEIQIGFSSRDLRVRDTLF